MYSIEIKTGGHKSNSPTAPKFKKMMKLYKELSVQQVKGGYAVFNSADRLTTQMKFVEAIAMQSRLSKIQKFRR